MWGRRWLRTGEGFAALFGLIGTLGCVHRDRETGQLRVRWPFTGPATIETPPGTAAVLLVVIGAVLFDGATHTELWADVLGDRTGWGQTLVSTVGLLWAIAFAAGVYLLAIRFVARAAGRPAPAAEVEAFALVLVPLAAAYLVAHSFEVLLYDTQNLVALLSDPLGRGWDLFGTIDDAADPEILSGDTVTWIEASVLATGHVVAAVIAHDRALALYPRRRAIVAGYPLVGALVVSAVGAVVLLLG